MNMNEKEFHIALTGHRPDKLDGYNLSTKYYKKLHDSLASFIIRQVDERPDTLIWGHSGLALGADTVWAAAILTAKKHRPGRVKFFAEIPTLGQSNKWPSQTDKACWKAFVSQADDKKVYSDTYHGGVMQMRNKGMVDHCDVLLSLWDKTPGGTANATKYAESAGKKIVYINPNSFR